MAKNYTKETSDKKLAQEIESVINFAEPTKESIDFILNYSKSLCVEKSEKLGRLFLNLN